MAFNKITAFYHGILIGAYKYNVILLLKTWTCASFSGQVNIFPLRSPQGTCVDLPAGVYEHVYSPGKQIEIARYDDTVLRDRNQRPNREH